MLELLCGLPTSWEVLRPSEPHLSLYSTRTKLGNTLEAKLTISSHFLSGGVGVFIGGEVGALGKSGARGAHLSGRPAISGGRAAKFHGRTDIPTSDPLLTDLT
jgi:hypothetical protein